MIINPAWRDIFANSDVFFKIVPNIRFGTKDIRIVFTLHSIWLTGDKLVCDASHRYDRKDLWWYLFIYVI